LSYFGDIELGDTIDVKFNTRDATGAPITLSGGTVAAYIDNSTTEITAGITLTTDFDARTGLHNIRVVVTGANGYTDGTNVQLVMTAGTVDSVSVVGAVVGTFSIGLRSLTKTDYTLPGQAAPPSTGSLSDFIAYLYKGFRNPKRQTTTEFQILNDAASTVDQKASVSSTSTQVDKGLIGTGP
jgi:hypothetical protein